jgi:hypothetical protein
MNFENKKLERPEENSWNFKTNISKLRRNSKKPKKKLPG